MKKLKLLLCLGLVFAFGSTLSSCGFLDMMNSETSLSSDEMSNKTSTNKNINTSDKDTTSSQGTSKEESKTYKLNKASYYEDKYYDDVVDELTDAGFTNVSVIRCGNLITGWMSTENTVREMSVAGDKSFSAGTYRPDVEIIVYVHSYDNKCPQSHKLKKISKSSPTCTEKGVSFDVYYCETCDEYFSDSKGNGPLDKSEVEISATGHTIFKVQKIDSTCSVTGTEEHYECSSCHKLFSDENGKNVVSKESCVIAKKAHTIVVDEAVDPTPTSPGLTEGSHCSVCHEVIKPQETIDWADSDVGKAKIAELEQAFPLESAKKAAVTIIENYAANDVYKDDGSALDPTKFHTFGDKTGNLEEYYIWINNFGTWSYYDEDTWHCEKLQLTHYSSTVKHIRSFNITKEDGLYKITNNVDARNVPESQKVEWLDIALPAISDELLIGDRKYDIRGDGQYVYDEPEVEADADGRVIL